MRKRYTLVYGQWGQNIGNAFFNLGGAKLIELVSGERPGLAQDMPGYWTLHRKGAGNFARWYDWISRIDTDYVVMQGPVLRGASETLWRETADALRRRGTRIIAISASFFSFSPSEIKAGVRFARNCGLSLIGTRDDVTFELLNSFDLDIPIIRGIDSSTFLPMHYDPVDLDIGPYVALSVNRYAEPSLRELSALVRAAEGDRGCLRYDLRSRLDRHYDQIAGRSMSLAMLLRMMDRRRGETELGDALGTQILRLDHRTSPMIPKITFARNNSIASDEPYTYLNLYGGARLVCTDRVHAAAVATAYGRPAAFLARTPRGALLNTFTNVALTGCEWEIRTLDKLRMEASQRRLVSELAAALNEPGCGG